MPIAIFSKCFESHQIGQSGPFFCAYGHVDLFQTLFHMGITTSKATIDIEQQPPAINDKKPKKKIKPCARATSRNKELDSANKNAKLPLSPWLHQRLRRISNAATEQQCHNKPQHSRSCGRKKHNVASISRKKNAKRKKVTKSIIGKPSNFQVRVQVSVRYQSPYILRCSKCSMLDTVPKIHLINDHTM